MPHVIVKLYAGKTDQQKRKIAAEITKAVMASAECAELSVSVSIEDVAPADWTTKVYRPDILAKPDRLVKEPGYGPL